jgi:ribosomal protein S12 methylthiotransferase accessory factor
MSAVLERRQNAGRGSSADGFKAYRRGTHRTVDPAATLARVRPYLQGMGITRVANVTGLDRIGIPVVMVCRPNARSLAVSQGKGLTLEAAKASGVMEAIELHCAERIGLSLKLGTTRDLAGCHQLVDLDALPPMAGSRYNPDLPLLWIEARDLFSELPTWVPYELVHANYTLPQPQGSGCFIASTNGLASGNQRSEALNHAIAEVVERDAISIWNHLDKARQDQTRIDLTTVDDADCADMLVMLERAEFAAAVWDATTDLGIPAFYCLITDERHPGAHSGAGSGAHPSRQVAFLRALTEAVQVRTTYITGSRDDLHPDEFTPPAIEQKLRRARTLMQVGGPRRDFRAVPSHDAPTCAADLAWMLARLRSVGVTQVLAVDLSPPDLGIAVTRVVIPGLEGPDDHERYLPGPRARRAGARRP